jgi:hypothetical protein
MNGRRVALAAGGALALGALAWWAVVAFVPEATLDIDEAQLQARLAARFPQRNCALMLACLTLSDPKVTLAEGSDRIGLAADVVVSLGRRTASGKVAFSGVLRYVRYRGEFYLDDVRIDNFELLGFPPELVEVVKERGPSALRRALEGHPIYTIRADSPQAALAKLAVRDARVVDGKVRVTFLRFGMGNG